MLSLSPCSRFARDASKRSSWNPFVYQCALFPGLPCVQVQRLQMVRTWLVRGRALVTARSRIPSTQSAQCSAQRNAARVHWASCRRVREAGGARAGNALASVGGFCAGEREIVDHQRLSGLGYCFSASLPPLLATAALGALRTLRGPGSPGLRAALQRNARLLRRLLSDLPGSEARTFCSYMEGSYARILDIMSAHALQRELVL